MLYLNWLLRAAVFVLLLGFAVKNDQPVVMRYFFGYEWQASLVVVLLMFFAAGVGLGILSGLSKVFLQGREIARLKSELRQKNNPANFVND